MGPDRHHQPPGRDRFRCALCRGVTTNSSLVQGQGSQYANNGRIRQKRHAKCKLTWRSYLFLTMTVEYILAQLLCESEDITWKQCLQVFTKGWHKLQISVQKTEASLYIDCTRIQTVQMESSGVSNLGYMTVAKSMSSKHTTPKVWLVLSLLSLNFIGKGGGLGADFIISL